MRTYVSVSTEPAKDNLINYVKQIESSADFLHCDVMDGEFVVNKSLNSNTIKDINLKSTIPLDVHLMVKNPSGIIENYLKAGSNILTLHFESYNNVENLINDLKKVKLKHCLAGVSIKLSTEVFLLKPILKYVDIVLLMSVELGKSGQKFDEKALKKIKELNELKSKHKFLIEVDGGINAENCNSVRSAGADILVSGSYVFDAENREQAINVLKG